MIIILFDEFFDKLHSTNELQEMEISVSIVSCSDPCEWETSTEVLLVCVIEFQLIAFLCCTIKKENQFITRNSFSEQEQK